MPEIRGEPVKLFDEWLVEWERVADEFERQGNKEEADWQRAWFARNRQRLCGS